MKYHYTDVAAVDLHLSMTVYEIDMLIKWLKAIENPENKYSLERMIITLRECIKSSAGSMANEGTLLLERSDD